jgi:hypothetical protein
MVWNMEMLGPERRAFLAGLPDRLLLDEATLVVHGSPRHVRDAVTAGTPLEELEAMFVGEECRLAFSGHSHRPVIRETATRRLVNVGSVGLSLGGVTSASFATGERDGAMPPGAWHVELHRVDYDLEAAIAALAASGCADEWPDFLEIYARTLRTGNDYLGRLLRATHDVPDERFFEAARAFLERTP